MKINAFAIKCPFLFYEYPILLCVPGALCVRLLFMVSINGAG
jgi:hypothetical protein